MPRRKQIWYWQLLVSQLDSERIHSKDALLSWNQLLICTSSRCGYSPICLPIIWSRMDKITYWRKHYYFYSEKIPVAVVAETSVLYVKLYMSWINRYDFLNSKLMTSSKNFCCGKKLKFIRKCPDTYHSLSRRYWYYHREDIDLEKFLIFRPYQFILPIWNPNFIRRNKWKHWSFCSIIICIQL